MAAFYFNDASLKLSFETGVDETGKAIITAKTYRNVRDHVEAAEVLAAVQVLASLSSYNLLFAEKVLTETIDN